LSFIAPRSSITRFTTGGHLVRQRQCQCSSFPPSPASPVPCCSPPSSAPSPSTPPTAVGVNLNHKILDPYLYQPQDNLNLHILTLHNTHNTYITTPSKSPLSQYNSPTSPLLLRLSCRHGAPSNEGPNGGDPDAQEGDQGPGRVGQYANRAETHVRTPGEPDYMYYIHIYIHAQPSALDIV
jgi:hypothetical protein